MKTTHTENALYRLTKVVWYLFYVVEALLLFRFLLKLLGANPSATFTDLVYGVSGIFTAPFVYVFSPSQIGGMVFEWSTLLALLVYWFIAWGIVKLLVMGRGLDANEVERGLEMQDNA